MSDREKKSSLACQGCCTRSVEQSSESFKKCEWAGTRVDYCKIGFDDHGRKTGRQKENRALQILSVKRSDGDILVGSTRKTLPRTFTKRAVL